MRITELRVNHLKDPIGFQLEKPVFSYILTDTPAAAQKEARICISDMPEMNHIIYDSGMMECDSACMETAFCPEPETRYWWQITATDTDGHTSVSDIATFRTARNPERDWSAEWIEADVPEKMLPVFVKTFTVEKAVTSAVLYATGLGVYEIRVDGVKQGNEVLEPGIHTYRDHIFYHTYELSLTAGEHTLEIPVGSGWYAGRYGFDPDGKPMGTELTVIAELDLLYEDGSRETLKTDESWYARRNDVTFSDIYDGEVLDMTADTSERFPVKKGAFTVSRLMPRRNPPVIDQETLTPVLIDTPKHETVLDMKQNMVGQFSMNVPAMKPGTKVYLQFGELLQDDCFYRDNLRTAKAEFTYISDGQPRTVRCRHTFYGFRYIKVTGWPTIMNPEDFKGIVVHSELDEIGNMTTSDKLVNRLIRNVRWGQKGNFLDIPTDCPQRDERMGWTGDAQIFSDTANFLYDSYAFYSKFGFDLYSEQKHCGGGVPYVVPMANVPGFGSTGWGEAATVIPWVTYMHFGDKSILRQQYQSMKDWVDFIKRKDEEDGGSRMWRTGFHFGDWLALDGPVPGGVIGGTENPLVATAYYCYSARLTAQAAEVLGLPEDAAYYRALSEEVREAFQNEYFTPSGRLAHDTQTAYAVCAFMDLIPERAKHRFARDMFVKLSKNEFLLNTGFVGTPYLCFALTKLGMPELAYRLLLNRRYPSWLYEVEMGATTVWERWNSVLPDGKISGIEMNSMNHYAYGSIAAWMFRCMAGINPEEPGFRKIRLAPIPDVRMRHVNARLRTPYGQLVSEWDYDGKTMIYEATVPCGTTATVVLPGGETIENLAAGTYRWSYQPDRYFGPKPGLDTPVQELMAIPEARELIARYLPEFVEGKLVFGDEGTTLRDLTDSPFSNISEAEIKKLEFELSRIEGYGS